MLKPQTFPATPVSVSQRAARPWHQRDDGSSGHDTLPSLGVAGRVLPPHPSAGTLRERERHSHLLPGRAPQALPEEGHSPTAGERGREERARLWAGEGRRLGVKTEVGWADTGPVGDGDLESVPVPYTASHALLGQVNPIVIHQRLHCAAPATAASASICYHLPLLSSLRRSSAKCAPPCGKAQPACRWEQRVSHTTNRPSGLPLPSPNCWAICV